ncbi:MAG: Zn-ribbon domain-containing OB-fold protein [Bacillota bacterium]
MGFEKFGRVSFTAQTKVGNFVDYLEKGELAGTKCPKCGRKYFPPRADCSWCPDSTVAWIKIEGTGKLVSFTRVHYGPTGFEDDVPYTLALADFNGVKVFGRLSKDLDEGQTKVGMEVKAVTAFLPGGQLSYELVPV